MSYVVIARRWRPQQFDDIIAQDHVSKTLSNAIANNRIAHSYIFTGPRGVGKTTSARILAKALNCEQGPTPNPCNECPSCKAITIGNSMDVLEIDGASNRGIDEIRNLRENIRYTPTLGKYRIYIIDEVHMLTKEAFNALLKTLEEPPSHALFIFATTEIHRVPATILSRCQRFDFRRIPLKTIMIHLEKICEGDNIEVEEEALLQIAKKADGSMRDSQSILDQIISFSGNKIAFSDVAQALGVIHQDIFFDISGHIKNGDLKALIMLSREIFSTGYDLNEFLLGLEDHFRNILVAHTTKSTELLDVSENYLARYEDAAGEFEENDLIGYLQTVADTALAVKTSQQPNLKFELGLIKLAKMPSSASIESILEKLDLLKKKAPHNRVAEPDPPGNYQSQAPQKSAQPVLNMDLIRKMWPEIINSVNLKKPTIASILENGRLISLNNNILELKFKAVNSFEHGLLNNHKKLIEQSLAEVVQFKLGVKIDAEVVEAEVKTSAAGNAKQESKQKKMEQIREEGGELISKTIDELGLELL